LAHLVAHLHVFAAQEVQTSLHFLQKSGDFHTISPAAKHAAKLTSDIIFDIQVIVKTKRDMYLSASRGQPSTICLLQILIFQTNLKSSCFLLNRKPIHSVDEIFPFFRRNPPSPSPSRNPLGFLFGLVVHLRLSSALFQGIDATPLRAEELGDALGTATGHSQLGGPQPCHGARYGPKKGGNWKLKEQWGYITGERMMYIT